MDKYVVVHLNDILGNPYRNIISEHDNLNDAIANKPTSYSGPNGQYIVVKKEDIDSVGNPIAVKIVHLFL